MAPGWLCVALYHMHLAAAWHPCVPLRLPRTRGRRGTEAIPLARGSGDPGPAGRWPVPAAELAEPETAHPREPQAGGPAARATAPGQGTLLAALGGSLPTPASEL